MKKLRKKVRASYTGSHNLDPVYVDESDTMLLNHQRSGDLLIDPEYDFGENLHSPVIAGVEDEELEEDLLDDMPEDGIFALDEDDELDASAFDDEDILEEDEDSLDPIAVLSDITEPKDTCEELNKTQDQNNVHTDVQREGTKPTEAKAKKVKAEETELVNNQAGGKIELTSEAEDFEMPLVDLDEVDDGVNTSEVMFASIDKTKLALHANRIIATIDEDAAERNEVGDEYLSDEFDEATLTEIESKGLRAGLRSMGFTLATVKVKADAQIKARVNAATSAFRKAQISAAKARNNVMAQCYAIASTGLNRNAFTDFTNPLRNELEATLKIAGVRDASRVVRAAFEKCGIEYAKTLMAAAEKISTLPEDSREGLLESLDMTQEPEESECDSDCEDAEELEADPTLYGDPTVEGSVQAALLKPIKAKVQATIASKPLSFGCY